MNERTRKQVALLLLGIFLGYSFFQFNKTIVESSELRRPDPWVYKKYYRFSDVTIIKSIPDEIDVQFNIIEGGVYYYDEEME